MASPPTAAAGGKTLWRAAGLISVLTMVSRVLGLVREQVFAHFMGAGFYSDAFRIGFRIPNLLRDLLAEGALSAAFVPTYTRALKEGGRDAAHRLVCRVVSVLALVLAVVVLAGVVGAGPLVRWMAPGFAAHAGKTELTILLTRVMMPFLPLVSLAAIAMGMLNAEERFGPAALAPALFNVMAILTAAVMYVLGWDDRAAVLGWSVGTLLGGVAQLAVQLPRIFAQGFRLHFDWAPGDPALRHMAGLMAPATLGMAAVQVNLFVSTFFASRESGGVSWLDYAFRVLYLPIGVFGVSVGTVAATGLAKQAAAHDLAGMSATLRRSLRSLAFLTIPSTVGMVVLATPIVRLLYQRGRFTPENTAPTAAALAVYSLGLVAYASIKVLAPAFYALGRTRIPLAASASAVVANAVTVVLLHPRFGYVGVAAGLVVSTFVNVLILYLALRRLVGAIAGPDIVGFVVRVVGASALMAAATHFAAVWLESQIGVRGVVRQAVGTLVPIAVGGALYVGASLVLGLPEARSLASVVRRRKG